MTRFDEENRSLPEGVSSEKAPVKKEKPRKKRLPWGLSLPFLLALVVLTVVSFIIPLRPTRSYAEKRSLKEFPEFSVETLLSGEYFDEITLWFSDTFPGRESWISASSRVTALHGIKDVSFSGNNFQADAIPVLPSKEESSTVQEESSVIAEEASLPEESVEESSEVQEESVIEEASEETSEEVSEEAEESSEAESPAEEESEMVIVDVPDGGVEVWGGVDAGDDADIIFGNVIQIGDFAFSYFGFSQYYSDRYAEIVSELALSLKDQGVRVVPAPIPQAVGVMVAPEFQEKLGCSEQNAVLEYIMGSMDDSVYTVNMFPRLVQHNDEYLYFRTDHHWTALGAYYGYQSICEALGMKARPLEDFEVLEQGEFYGSFYGSAPDNYALRVDEVTSYIPPGNIDFKVSGDCGYSFWEYPIVADMSNSTIYSKYMCFIAGDNSLCVATNDTIKDDSACLVIKDSCGNPVVPFLTQNYHTVYVMDFRSYNRMNVSSFCEEYGVDDVILAHMLGFSQSEGAISIFNWLLK